MNILVAIHSEVAAWNIPVEHVERLRKEFPRHTFVHATNDALILDSIGSAEIGFMGEINDTQFAAARALRWIHSPAAGVGNMLFPGMRDSPVIISNSRGMSANVIAEHVVALTLALFRKLPVALRAQAERRWAQNEMYRPPVTRTIVGAAAVVIGTGGIGGGVARRLTSLGASVTGIRRNPQRGRTEGVDRVDSPDHLLDHLYYADVVVIAAPHTPSTHHLIGPPELAAMRRDAILINVSRGPLVDESALAAALASNTIGGAGLDVFEREPLDPSSPLWTLPNVIITPHTSGFRPDHWDAATDLFAGNLRRFESGEPLLNVVDKHAGY